MRGNSSLVAALTWDVVASRLADGAAALLPIGAGAKEHGLHLPMNTDEIQANWLAAQAASRHDLLVWPALTYGYYPAFSEFAGSISLLKDTFTAVVREVLDGLAAWKPRAIFVLDTGISTIAPVDAVIAAMLRPSIVHHLRIHEGPAYRAAAKRVAEQSYGSHADELETSRMLVIAPEAVAMDRAQGSPSGPFSGPLTLKNAPSGSYGDPTKASAAKGEILVAAMLEDINAAIGHALR